MFVNVAAHAFVIMSMLGFALTVLDRILAKTTRIRIPEVILFVIACLFGALGVTLGFFLAKRGLYKQETRLGVPAIALGEIVLAIWMIPGFWNAVGNVFSAIGG